MIHRRHLLAGGAALGLSALLPRPARADTAAPQDPLDLVVTADPGELDLSLRVEGALPHALLGGRYLLNGPARLRVGGRLVHPFDGHGYLRVFSFEPGGRVRLRARFIRTAVFDEEEAAGHLTRRGVGSLVAYPGERRWAHQNRQADGRRNVANTTVTPWGGALLCGWEGGRPTAVDPDSLMTRGLQDFGGALGEGPFLAHVRPDLREGVLVGLSMQLGPETVFTFHELGPDNAERSRQTLALKGASFQHDFAISERWYVTTDNPLTLDPGGLVRMLRGRGDMLSAIRAADAEGSVLLLPRAGGEAVRVPLGRKLWAIHHLNAHDEGEHVVLYTCGFDQMSFGGEFGYQGPDQPLSSASLVGGRPQKLLRIVVDPATARLVELREMDNRAVDFPRVRPDREGVAARWGVAAARGQEGQSFPFDTLLAFDLSDPERPAAAWSAGRRFVGEPVLVPHGDEGGVVLAMAYDPEARSSTLYAFEVEDLAAGPVARVPIPTLLPHGFHGGWLPVA